MNEPTFRLDAKQNAALLLIESMQHTLLQSANTLAAIDMKPAGEMLVATLQFMEAAKLKWLQETQRLVKLVDVSDLGERAKANGASIG